MHRRIFAGGDVGRNFPAAGSEDWGDHSACSLRPSPAFPYSPSPCPGNHRSAKEQRLPRRSRPVRLCSCAHCCRDLLLCHLCSPRLLSKGSKGIRSRERSGNHSPPVRQRRSRHCCDHRCLSPRWQATAGGQKRNLPLSLFLPRTNPSTLRPTGNSSPAKLSPQLNSFFRGLLSGKFNCLSIVALPAPITVVFTGAAPDFPRMRMPLSCDANIYL